LIPARFSWMKDFDLTLVYIVAALLKPKSTYHPRCFWTVRILKICQLSKPATSATIKNLLMKNICHARLNVLFALVVF